MDDDLNDDGSMEAMEMPSPEEEPENERTMILDAVEIPPPPEDVLDDSALAEDERGDFGGPDDGSEEQPMLVVGPSDEAQSLPDEPIDDGSDEVAALEFSRDTPLRGAYEYLEIRTPIAEFESYARARTEALVRLGDSREAEIAALAMSLGTSALRRVMGAIPKETS
ncbi:MAG: hypothetical protein JKY65_09650 [Planctomycetes bacterium]|nr:hypothetical protein [Planctomycetota bacterium]